MLYCRTRSKIRQSPPVKRRFASAFFTERTRGFGRSSAAPGFRRNHICRKRWMFSTDLKASPYPHTFSSPGKQGATAVVVAERRAHAWAGGSLAVAAIPLARPLLPFDDAAAIAIASGGCAVQNV